MRVGVLGNEEREHCGFDEFPNNNLISEGGMSKVVRALCGKEFGIITAYRGKIGDRTVNKKENTQRNRQLRGDLNRNSMGGYSLVGHWEECHATGDDGRVLPYEQCPSEAKVDSVERSYLIPKPSHMDSDQFKEVMISMGSKYDQDSVVYGDGEQIHVLYPDGSDESFGKTSFGVVGQAYSQHTRNMDVPFVFGGIEIPGSNSGKQFFRHSGVDYPVMENRELLGEKDWKTFLGG